MIFFPYFSYHHFGSQYALNDYHNTNQMYPICQSNVMYDGSTSYEDRSRMITFENQYPKTSSTSYSNAPHIPHSSHSAAPPALVNYWDLGGETTLADGSKPATIVTDQTLEENMNGKRNRILIFFVNSTYVRIQINYKPKVLLHSFEVSFAMNWNLNSIHYWK